MFCVESDEVLDAIAQNSPDIESFTVLHRASVSHDAFVRFAQRCTKLTHILLDGIPRIRDAAITAIALNCPGLRVFNAYNCIKITDNAVRALSIHCKQLISVYFCFCIELTDTGVILLTTRFQHLHSIEFIACPRITRIGETAIADYFSPPTMKRTWWFRCREALYVALLTPVVIVNYLVYRSRTFE